MPDSESMSEQAVVGMGPTVFVSSSLADTLERASVRTALINLGMRPILFEDRASPNPPRVLYERYIKESVFFVAVYTTTYGQPLPQSTISGLEDEFNLAEGRTRLIYIKDVDDAQRDPRLVALIRRIEQEGILTYSRYDTPEHLAQKVCRDIMQLVYDSSSGGATGPAVQIPDYLADLTARLAGTIVLPRSELLSTVESAVDGDGLVILVAPPGGGKTFLLGLLASQRPSVYVSLSGRESYSIAAYLATRVSVLTSRAIPGRFPDLEAALVALAEAATPNVLMLLDNCAANPELSRVLAERLRGRCHVVLSSQSDGVASLIGGTVLMIPPLTVDEAAELLRLRGLNSTPARTLDAVVQTGGNPLLLAGIEDREYGIPRTIGQFFSRQWALLSDPQKDMVAMCSLAYGGDVSVEDLAGLRAMGHSGTLSPSLLTSDLEASSCFLQFHGSRLTVASEAARQWVITQLRSVNTENLYHLQLGTYFKSRGRVLRAYYHLQAAGDAEAATVLTQAMVLAALQGDWVLARLLASRCISGDFDEEAVSTAHFVLAQGLAAIGDIAGAEREADVASALLGPGDDHAIRLWRASLLVETERANDAVAILIQALSDCTPGDTLGKGVIQQYLSYVYINLGRYQLAADCARSAFSDFEQAGDPYGMQFSEVNLAGAMLELDQYEEAGTILERRLESARKGGSWEQISVLLNMRARLRRRADDLAGAREDLAECIRLNRVGGDVHREVMNLINLGNVYLDMGQLDEAEQCYREGLERAEALGLIPSAIHAKQLLGRLRIEKNDIEGGRSLLQDSLVQSRARGDRARVAFAAEWLGWVGRSQGQWHNAAQLYTESARAYFEMPDIKAGSRNLLLGADCASCGHELPVAQALLLEYERVVYVNGDADIPSLIVASQTEDDATRLVLLALHSLDKSLLRTSLHLLLLSGDSQRIADVFEMLGVPENPESDPQSMVFLQALARCLLISETSIAVEPIVEWCIRRQPGAPRIAWRHADSTSPLDCVILPSTLSGAILEETILIPLSARVFGLTFGSMLASCAVGGQSDQRSAGGPSNQVRARQVLMGTPNDIKDIAPDSTSLAVSLQPAFVTCDPEQLTPGSPSISLIIVDQDTSDRHYGSTLLSGVLAYTEKTLSPDLTEDAVRERVSDLWHQVMDLD
jgi:tetratricopeptide (TPR) repeat protein